MSSYLAVKEGRVFDQLVLRKVAKALGGEKVRERR